MTRVEDLERELDQAEKEFFNIRSSYGKTSYSGLPMWLNILIPSALFVSGFILLLINGIDITSTFCIAVSIPIIYCVIITLRHSAQTTDLNAQLSACSMKMNSIRHNIINAKNDELWRNKNE